MEKTLLNLAKQPNFITSLLELFIDGETMEKFLTEKPLQDTFYTRLNNLIETRKINTSTFVSAHINKKTIYNDRKSLPLNSFHLIKLLVILDQVLTSNDQDLKDFLNWLCPIVLKRLSLQAKTDFVDSDLTSLNGYVMKTIQNSWFLTKIQTCPEKANSSETSCPLSKFIHANGTDNEDTLVKARKIKLKLTSNQKELFNKWNDHHRYTYNTSIFRLNTDINIPNKLKLRNELVAAENLKNKEWLLKTPKEIRARAVFEAHTRVITGIKQIKNKTIKFFKMSFKDKKFQKENGWCIDIPKQSIKKVNDTTVILYPRITNNSKVQLTESFSGNIESDCKLQFDGVDYFIIIPFKVTKSNIPDRNRMISLDPGVRTFLSGVDTDKRVEIGDKANEKMYPLLKKLDRYIGRSKTATKKCQTKFKKRIKQLRKRIKNLQQELHKKTSSWLCKNYTNIIIPDFQSLEMSKKQGRKIKTKTVRQMSVLGHKMFLQRLKTKAIETNTNVIIVEESYTSKTCAYCEFVKSGIFTSKVFKCESCGVKMDRDTNGSINIFKKLFKH